MLRRILKQKRYFKNIYKAQHGITGLETAIILIAFVVVAAVFAYTVLSAGLFSTQKSQEVVYSGLEETQNTLEIKGGILAQADPKFADTCEDAANDWDAGTSGAVADEATILHEGTGSIAVTGDGSVAAGDTLAVSATAAITAAEGDTITFWAKISNAAAASSDVGFAVNAAVAGCIGTATTKVVLDGGDTEWHQYTATVNVADVGACYYGLYGVTTDLGANKVYIDDIQVNNVSLWQSTYAWTPYATDVILTLGLASSGQPIDFSAGTDSNADGLYTSADNGGTKTNKIVVNYNDAYNHVSDVAWTAVWVGNDNGDRMLDPGEKLKLTISLDYINAGPNDVDANHQFTLEIKSPKGAVLSLERTMPARLYSISNLN